MLVVVLVNYGGGTNGKHEARLKKRVDLYEQVIRIFCQNSGRVGGRLRKRHPPGSRGQECRIDNSDAGSGPATMMQLPLRHART